MGAEMTHRTKAASRSARKERAEATLDASLEEEKRDNPFLDGVPAIVEALKPRQIECRVYTKDKFHAKAYITHAKLDVVGSRALVGSSQLHASRPDREHRAEHPGPERPRGRPASGVVRAALERGRGRHARGSAGSRAPRPRVLTVRGLREGVCISQVQEAALADHIFQKSSSRSCSRRTRSRGGVAHTSWLIYHRGTFTSAASRKGYRTARTTESGSARIVLPVFLGALVLLGLADVGRSIKTRDEGSSDRRSSRLDGAGFIIAQREHN